jgi:hypothetical protein
LRGAITFGMTLLEIISGFLRVSRLLLRALFGLAFGVYTFLFLFSPVLFYDDKAL